MTIIDAIRSGKQFRRRKGIYKLWYPAGLEDYYGMPGDSLLAEDWEVLYCEACDSITQNAYDGCYNDLPCQCKDGGVEKEEDN